MNSDIEEDLFYSTYQIEMERILRGNDLFFHFEQAVGKVMLLYDNNKLSFLDSNEGNFAKEVLARMLEESAGYIGCLKQGAFFVANHHTRALIELFASTFKCFKIGNKKRYLERFIRFPEIEFHKISIKDKKALFGVSEDLLKKLFKQYEKLDPELLLIFKKDTIEELLEIKNWRGDDCGIKNMIEELPYKVTHLKNYDILCLYTHFSSLLRCSETNFFSSFSAMDRLMLAITINYALNTCFFLQDEKFFDEKSIKKLKEVFFPVFSALSPELKPCTSKSNKN